MQTIEADTETQAWIRNRSDELAVANGCRFDAERGQFVCDWIETHCHLYEGSRNLIELLEWEREAFMRIFGWVKWSQRLGRWIRRFTRATIFLPKKNGKSPALASLALYLLAGDGEQGNHVFFTAADGGQARIAAKHAVEMVRASPQLDQDQGGEIRINLNEMKMTHVPTLSDARPISSGDKRAAQAKQGLNGSVCVDELHVLTREFVSESSIDRAGASRDEPLFIAVSTAGKDPDSYGKFQYDYGKQVESGDVADQSYFFLCYEAPQQLTDNELAADPVKWGRMANPAWGELIHEEEFLADYHRSRLSLADLADFKTFRLNIWQTSASPWIRASDWKACERRFHEDDLAGMPCAAGLDLSKVYDMTALVLCFPWDETDDEGAVRKGYRILPYFFLPSSAVRRLAIQFPQILDWVERGFIIETDGDVIDYAFLKKKWAEVCGKYSIVSLLFDPHQAEALTQQMSEETGVVREEFSQTIMTFNEPTQDFEREVVSGLMQHNGNPVMTWQVGHCKVKTDANANKRPIKPKQDDSHKIDGVVAAIMARAGAGKIINWYVPGQGL